MGLLARQPLHARDCDGPRRFDDSGAAKARLWQRWTGQLLGSLIFCLFAAPVAAETLRIATFHTELARDGPGVLVRDIEQRAPDVLEVADIIVSAQADVIVLQGVDYDYGQAAITGLATLIAEKGVDYPYRFALRPNTGMQTGLDMDGNGSVGEPRDAQGYGRFSGQGGMAILSRFPVLQGDVRDFSDLRWRDLPGAQLPMVDGAPFPSAEVHEVQRLSSTGHWDVPLVLPDNELLHIWTFHATPPVFDGPEDRNGKRNHDEIAFWMRYLEGAFGPIARQTFVIAGVTNLDPVDGEGLHQVMRDLLSHPDIQDPEPRSAGALQASDPDHMGDPALDTADFGDIGSLRVSYLLPSVQWDILDQGVLWPEAEADAEASGRRHHLVWVDIAAKSED